MSRAWLRSVQRGEERGRQALEQAETNTLPIEGDIFVFGRDSQRSEVFGREEIDRGMIGVGQDVEGACEPCLEENRRDGSTTSQ